MVSSTEFRETKIKAIKDIFVSLMVIVKRHFSQRLQPHGLTHAQFITLVALTAHQQPCTMSDLTLATMQDAPTMTGIVDRLIKMDLVERTRSVVDRRVVLVQPSSEGAALVGKIESEILQDASSGFAGLSDENLAKAEQLLTEFIRTYMNQHLLAEGVNLEESIEKLKIFSRDPISYARLLNEKPHEEYESLD